MSVADKGTPARARSRDASSVAASESIPTSISGDSALSATRSPGTSASTSRNTAASACARRSLTGSAPTLSANDDRDAGAANAELWSRSLRRSYAASSSKRRSDASDRSLSSSRTSDRCTSCTLRSSPRSHTLSCAARHAAYSSSEIPHMPTIDILRDASRAYPAAPIPAPPTIGHCTASDTTPIFRRQSARPSRLPFAAA